MAANETCLTAQVITLPFAAVLNLVGVGNSPGTPDDSCGSGDSNNSLWYKWTCPTGQTRLRIILSDEDEEGIVHMFDGTCGALNFDGWCWSSDEDDSEVEVEEGVDYFFLVTSYDPDVITALTFELSRPEATGDVIRTLSCDSPPPAPTTPEPTLVNSTPDPCCGEQAGVTPHAGPVEEPSNFDWTPECTGGGTVPTAADIELTEEWDVA